MQKLDGKVKEILRQMYLLNKKRHRRMVHGLPHRDMDAAYNHLFESLVLAERSGSEVVQ